MARIKVKRNIRTVEKGTEKDAQGLDAVFVLATKERVVITVNVRTMLA